MLKRKLTALVSDIVINEVSSLAAAPNASDLHDAEWRNAVLRRLQRRSGGAGQGTLYCHPSVQHEVSTWLYQHPHLGWEVREDTALTDTRVKLVTAQGETLMQWCQTVFQP